MTHILRPTPSRFRRALAGGLMLLGATHAWQAATAASIGEVVPAPLGGEVHGHARGDLLHFAPLGADTEPRRRPRASRAEIARLVDSFDLPRPVMTAGTTDWMPALAAATATTADELLAPSAETRVWLDEQAALMDRPAGSPGLQETLRGLVNVYDAPADGVAWSARDAIPGARQVAALAGGLGGGDLLRDLLEAAIEPHRRADGQVGFSIFGVGEFVARIDSSRRSITLYEETAGLRASFTRPAPASASPVAEATQSALAGTPQIPEPPPGAVAGVRPVSEVHFSLVAWIASALDWLQESMVPRVLIAVWLLWAAARGVLAMDRSLRAGREAPPEAIAAPLAPATGEALAALPELPGPRPSRRSRRSRRRRRSPTMRNLLRSVGLA